MTPAETIIVRLNMARDVCKVTDNVYGQTDIQTDEQDDFLQTTVGNVKADPIRFRKTNKYGRTDKRKKERQKDRLRSTKNPRETVIRAKKNAQWKG